MMMKRCLTAIVCGCLLPAVLLAELKLASPFSDHMVLQRDMPVPVWGWGDPGAKVTVQFAGQSRSVVVHSSGLWRVTLDPMPASFESRTLTVSATQNSQLTTLKCADVVVGEVWICSGQSNMQFGYGGVAEIKALVPTAKNIRSFTVKRTVAFEEQRACEGEWREEVPNSAVAFSFAYLLQEKAQVPVGIILACWGSSGIEAWMPRDMVWTVPHFKTIMAEFDADAETRNRIQSILDGPKPWSRGDDIFLRRQSNILYNAMMIPLVPFACRGLVWYQGERNTQSMFGMLESPWYSRNSGMLKYADTLKQWIKRYRQAWKRSEMHFLVVMLPGLGKTLPTGPEGGAESPIAHSWAWMRESQLKALELPHTGVANTIDLGDIKNVHPKDKLPIGERLALLAARDTLGLDVEADGPVMKRVTREGGQLVVHFDHADGLQTKDGSPPAGFWVADDSAKWMAADATVEGNTVVLRSSGLKAPRYVRYAFAGKPNVNLVNGAGLPAYPFRTDRFEP